MLCQLSYASGTNAPLSKRLRSSVVNTTQVKYYHGEAVDPQINR